ncbi:unnamed protein product [Rangifer tarandus platyrhynchus]|uniref:Uncharacterized protein n=1 Tax=Rangifer tarandus platyrhynchus TaxID=3082113 RepID=A0AC59ZV25_RANTA
MGFSRQEYWSGLPFPPPGDLPDPGLELASPKSPAFFTAEARSGAGAGDGGEDDVARDTPRSDRGGMALAGQGDPTSRSWHPLAGLALRSSVWARQRAPGGRGGGGAGTPGTWERAVAVSPGPHAAQVRGSEGWPGSPDSGELGAP